MNSGHACAGLEHHLDALCGFIPGRTLWGCVVRGRDCMSHGERVLRVAQEHALAGEVCAEPVQAALAFGALAGGERGGSGLGHQAQAGDAASEPEARRA